MAAAAALRCCLKHWTEVLDAALGGARRRLDIDRAPAASQPASTAMKAVTASKDGTLHVDYNKPFHFSNCHDARGEDVCRG